MGRSWSAWLVVPLVLLVSAAPAVGHVRSTTGYSVIRADAGEVYFRLSLEYELLARPAGS